MATAVLLTSGAWWALAEMAPTDAVSTIDEDEWRQLRLEVAELRSEVDRLRQDRANAEGSAERATRTARKASSSLDRIAAGSDPTSDLSPPAETSGKQKKASKTTYWQARERLEQLEDVDARRDLAMSYLDSEEFWVRAEAVQALLDADSAAGVAAMHDFLVDAAEQPKGAFIAVETVERLGDIEAISVSGDLYRIYDDVDIKGVGVAAARALERQGDRALMAREIGRITATLRDGEPQRRLQSVRELGRTRSPAAVPHLLPLVQSQDVEVRMRAVEALGSTGEASEITVLEELLDDPVGAVRDRAVEALAELRRRVGR